MTWHIRRAIAIVMEYCMQFIRLPIGMDACGWLTTAPSTVIPNWSSTICWSAMKRYLLLFFFFIFLLFFCHREWERFDLPLFIRFIGIHSRSSPVARFSPFTCSKLHRRQTPPKLCRTPLLAFEGQTTWFCIHSNVADTPKCPSTYSLWFRTAYSHTTITNWSSWTRPNGCG